MERLLFCEYLQKADVCREHKKLFAVLVVVVLVKTTYYCREALKHFTTVVLSSCHSSLAALVFCVKPLGTKYLNDPGLGSMKY